MWGVSPITLSQSEIYESVEKNVVDGYLNVWPGVYAFKQYEVTKYFLDIPIFCNQLMILIGKDKWESLPADIQDAILSCSGREASLNNFYRKLSQNTALAKDAILEYGDEIYVPTEEEYNTFAEASDQVSKAWVEQYDALEVYDKAKEILAGYNKQ
jgi:TRAP-type C4-dicarboxylate transport system substrate-binding protein